MQQKIDQLNIYWGIQEAFKPLKQLQVDPIAAQ